MVDALIAREASKKESEQDQQKVIEELKERIRSGEKDAFVESYHTQIEEYDQARALVFDDWKRWIDSDELARKLEFNDCYCAEGFEAVEQELADILDGYVGAEKGKEDADRWLEADEGEAAPAAKMGAWAKDPQTWPQWKKWIKAVQKRYNIDVHRQGITLNTATDLFTAVHRKSLAGTGHTLAELVMTPMAAGMADARIRNYLNRTLIDVFHLTPDFKDNPFGWLHTRLEPVVENIKQNRGKFIGAVTFFHAINVASLFSGLEKTQQDVMLGTTKPSSVKTGPIWPITHGASPERTSRNRSIFAKLEPPCTEWILCTRSKE